MRNLDEISSHRNLIVWDLVSCNRWFQLNPNPYLDLITLWKKKCIPMNPNPYLDYLVKEEMHSNFARENCKNYLHYYLYLYLILKRDSPEISSVSPTIHWPNYPPPEWHTYIRVQETFGNLLTATIASIRHVPWRTGGCRRQRCERPVAPTGQSRWGCGMRSRHQEVSGRGSQGS